MSPSLFNSLRPEPTGPSGRQVGQNTRLNDPPSSWSQATGDCQLGHGPTEVHQLSKRIPLHAAGLSLFPALERGVLASLWLDPQKMDLGSDPPRADSYT